MALPPRYRKLGRESLPPGSPVPEPPQGFALAEHLETRSFTLVRFRADDPRPVTRQDIVPLALGPESPALFLETPTP